MEIIKDIVTDVLKGIKKKKAFKEDPDALLKKVLTKKELSHVKFRYLKKGVLGIAVDSSGWLYELNLRKPALLSGLKGISDIRFYMGELS